ncbi:MAG: hypothetical protein ACXVI3_04030 [Halobacteriota archaeon]
MKTTNAEGNPFPNEHGCRMRDPDDFREDSFRTNERVHEGKKYLVILAKLPGDDSMLEQSYRFPKEIWSEEAARTHCKDHGGKTFEPVRED